MLLLFHMSRVILSIFDSEICSIASATHVNKSGNVASRAGRMRDLNTEDF